MSQWPVKQAMVRKINEAAGPAESEVGKVLAVDRCTPFKMIGVFSGGYPYVKVLDFLQYSGVIPGILG